MKIRSFKPATFIILLFIANAVSAEEKTISSSPSLSTEIGGAGVGSETSPDAQDDTAPKTTAATSASSETDTETSRGNASPSMQKASSDTSVVSGDGSAATPARKDSGSAVQTSHLAAKIESDTAKDKSTELTGALEKEPGLQIEGQLAGLFEATDEPLQPGNEFSISRARIELSWTQWKLITAKVKIEAKELFQGEGFSSILRDLYVKVQPIKQLGFRLGQFKKPFSRMELSPWSKFPFIKRGASNRYIVKQLMYGVGTSAQCSKVACGRLPSWTMRWGYSTAWG